MASDDEDVPETGAVFTFGKSRFADNLASKFWIRDDPVVQVACGDEHSAIITAKGKLYTFGSNDWGQLGHGNTKPYNKPSVVKKLKPEKSYLVACGRNHTLVATESGRLYSFGCGGDGQLGHEDSEYSHEPKAIELLDSQQYSILACGSDFSAAVTENGILYTWGSSSEGQNGLGEDTESPKRLYLSGKVVSVACGYYHMAVVTDDGSLYTCGEGEGGKLGLEKSQLDDTSQLQKVESIKEKVTAVSCGAEFTVAVTQNGHVYSFGQGNQGQLGLGSALTECELPEKVQTFNKVKAKSVDCGENFTSIITKHGNLYTFGDGRHGKLGLGDECFSNLFTPQKVTRFNNFIIKKVSCGGCHMLASAVRKEESVEESDSEEQAEKETLATTLKPGQLLDAVDGPSHLSSTWSARDKRRQKHVEDINNSLSHSLPPINKSSLPPLNGTLKRTLPALGKGFLNEEEKKPVNPLNASKLPKITHLEEEEDNQTTATSKSTPTSSPKPLPRGLAKPSPLAAPRTLPRTRKEKEETESEEESGSEEESDEEEEGENGNSGKIKKEGMMKTGESEKEVKKQVKKEEEESEEDEEESETEEDEDEKQHSKQATVKDKTTKAATTTKEVKKKDEEEDEEESEEEEEDDDDEEEEDDNKNKKKIKDKNEDKKKTKSKRIEVGSSAKKGEKDSEEEEGDDEEDDEEDKDAMKKKKKKDSKQDEKEKKKKSKKKSKDEDEDEETDDKEATEENTEKTKKGKNKGEKKKETKEKDEEEEEEDEDEDKDKEKEKEKTNEDNKEGDSKNKESAKNTAKQKDKKSGICVLI